MPLPLYFYDKEPSDAGQGEATGCRLGVSPVVVGTQGKKESLRKIYKNTVQYLEVFYITKFGKY